MDTASALEDLSAEGPEPWHPKSVIVIERCSGVQVGEDNVQHSAYWIQLPTVALESVSELARQLFSDDLPMAGDHVRCKVTVKEVITDALEQAIRDRARAIAVAAESDVRQSRDLAELQPDSDDHMGSA